MSKRVPLFACEDCKLVKLYDQKSLLCEECDESWARHCAVSDKVREAHWAASHRCRDCGVGLPTTRYFKCEYCLPLEQEDRFDESPDCDAEMHNHRVDKGTLARELLATGEKQCSTCGETKPLGAFARAHHQRGGLQSRCRACHPSARKEVAV